MEVCNEHGEPIVYVGTRYDECPACAELKDLRENHEDEVDELKGEIGDLENQVSSLEDETESLKDEIENIRYEMEE